LTWRTLANRRFRVINQLIPPLLRDMLERGQIQIETQVLTHRYLNLAARCRNSLSCVLKGPP
jgi:hypothetical protein